MGHRRAPLNPRGHDLAPGKGPKFLAFGIDGRLFAPIYSATFAAGRRPISKRCLKLVETRV
jgi:hypothetical protein